jgi:hypothetical protein
MLRLPATPGPFYYFCGVEDHCKEGMVGTIDVLAKGASLPADNAGKKGEPPNPTPKDKPAPPPPSSPTPKSDSSRDKQISFAIVGGTVLLWAGYSL